MTGRPPLRPSAAGTIIAVLALLVLAADQFTKYLALKNLPPEEPVHVIGDFLIFYLVRNPGAAFSLGEGVTWLDDGRLMFNAEGTGARLHMGRCP